jgi:formate dehydrogenase major subunit
MALRGDEPFVMQPDGRGWLFAPSGVLDGPLPARYEPEESPLDNPLYEVGASPTALRHERPANRRNQDAHRFPYVRSICGIGPELAAERGRLNVGSRLVNQVGLPFHWGSRGLTRGDSANDLLLVVLDPNVDIQAATCDIRPGRRGS